jgi:hypothetical protein
MPYRHLQSDRRLHRKILQRRHVVRQTPVRFSVPLSQQYTSGLSIMGNMIGGRR